MRERMEVAEGFKGAISDEAGDVKIPGKEVAESLDGGDEPGFKRFMRENCTKEFIDSFGITLGEESKQ